MRDALLMMAAEFYWVNESGSLATYARVLSVVVSEPYALGPGSGIEVMTPHWRAMPDVLQVVLGVHAFLASVALCIGPFLFLDRLQNVEKVPTDYQKQKQNDPDENHTGDQSDINDSP